MPRNIGIFDTSIGIQGVLQHEDNTTNIPSPRPLAANAMVQVGLEDIYLPSNANRMIEAVLCPKVGDGKILRPDIFTNNLRNCLATLQESRNTDVRSFVRKDLTPMLEDNSLLQAYVGLMVGG